MQRKGAAELVVHSNLFSASNLDLDICGAAPAPGQLGKDDGEAGCRQTRAQLDARRGPRVAVAHQKSTKEEGMEEKVYRNRSGREFTARYTQRNRICTLIASRWYSQRRECQGTPLPPSPIHHPSPIHRPSSASAQHVHLNHRHYSLALTSTHSLTLLHPMPSSPHSLP